MSHPGPGSLGKGPGHAACKTPRHDLRPRRPAALQRPDSPRARLLDEAARIAADKPTIHFSGAMASTGYTLFAGGLTVALLFGLGGTGDVASMAFFLVGLPGGVAAIGLAMVIVGVIKFSRAIRARHFADERLDQIREELRLEFAPTQQPAGVEVLTF